MQSVFRSGAWTTLILFALVTLLVSQPCSAQVCGTSVPSTYLDLCNMLSGDLNAFNTTLSGLGATPSPALITGELSNANANNGPQIVNSGYMVGVQTQIQMLKAQGVQAIAVRVDFPMLYQPFFSSQSVYQQYVTFYSQVASAIRAAGMKLVVENTLMMSSGGLAGWIPQLAAFYPTLNWTQYEAARAQTAVTIAQTMQPDYMIIVEEPDNEARYSGQTNANTVSGSTNLVDQIHSALLLAGLPSLKVGAGVGSWLPAYQTFTYGYLGLQCSASQSCVTIPLDFLDMHIYTINNLGSPSNKNFLASALWMAQTAASAGKPVAMSECWDWKVRNNELNVLTPDQIMSRNAFDFWAPVDSYFLQTMATFANDTQMLFWVPFNSQDFSAYLSYATIGNMTPSQIYSAWFAAATAAMNAAMFTTTGMSYYYANVTPPDTIPPTTPGSFAGISGSPSTVNLTWNASTDNVGIAGYHLWRNGTQLPNLTVTQLVDSGLAGNTTYTYQVAAFDLGGNMSPTSVVTVTTQNSTTPNPPTNLTGVAVSGSQINLKWTAPTGGAPLTSYLVFRGTTATNLVQIAQLSNTYTSFNNYYLTPGTTYYYGVEAVAKSLISPMSTIVMVTTLAAPTPPANLVATPTSSTQVNLTWSASSAPAPISGYYVFRGTSPSTVNQQLVIVKSTYYNDKTASPATTYYYAVQARDTLGDNSALSAIASATTNP